MGVGALNLSAINQGSRKAVFLDRDGVLNRAVIRDGKPYPPANVSELQITPGATAALASLQAAGFELYVVTNQPDIARGTATWPDVEAIHSALSASLPLDGFYICPHDNADRCDCRKPNPGLLLRAASDHSLSLAASYMIGDRWRDVEAGQRAGCRTIWLDCGYAERRPSRDPDVTLDSLTEAAAWILQQEGVR